MRLLQQLLWIAALSFIGVHAELLESCTECQNNITYSGSCNKLTGADATCVCADGYQEDDNDFTKCVDIDECAGSAHGCKSGAAEDCKNSVAAHECINCPTGRVLNNLKQCVEDMCSGSSHECKSGAAEDCDSNQGAYKCINCPIDHVLNQDYRCVDDSVCQGVCVASASLTGICRDINGKPHCTCLPGYALNPINTRQCRDVDECADDDDNSCASKGACSNTAGSYTCFECPDNHVKDSVAHCVEDMCSGSSHGCKSGAAEDCDSNQGTHKCINCPINHVLNQDDRCVDDSHCLGLCVASASHTGVCREINNKGVCTCQPGYAVNPSRGRECNDVDECAGSAHGCKSGAAEDCKNSVGAYECINCPTGQVLNKLKQCVGR